MIPQNSVNASQTIQTQLSTNPNQESQTVNAMPSSPTIPQDLTIAMNTLMDNAKEGHTMRAKPNNFFLASLTSFTLGGALLAGVGIIPGAIVGLIVGLIGRSVRGSVVANSNEFNNVQSYMTSALGSTHALSVSITDSSSFTGGSKMDDTTIGNTQITNIIKSNDNKIIKFTVNGKEICARHGDDITKDKLNQVIFSAIAQNESDKNLKFNEYYNPQSSSGTTDNGCFGNFPFDINLSDLLNGC